MATATAGIPEREWRQLGNTLDGDLLLPSDDGYQIARRTYVGGDHDVLPAALASCATVDDVVRSVRFAAQTAVPIAVRSGGNSYADYSSTPGLLVELSRLNRIHVQGDRVWLGPGARTGRVQEALAAAGVWMPTGSCPMVAVGGAVLAGGFGLTGRRYGLAADVVRRAEIVTADGTRQTVAPDREADLFWSLRGGGGVTGVLTAVEMTTFPAGQLTMVFVQWSAAHAEQLIKVWQDIAPDLPTDATLHLSIVAGNGGPTMVHLLGCVLGDSLRAEARLRSIFAVAPRPTQPPVVRELSISEAGAYLGGALWRDGRRLPASSPFPPRPGFHHGTSEFFAGQLPDTAIGLLADLARSTCPPNQARDIEFTPWGGSYDRVPAQDSAFVHRTARFLVAHRCVLGANANAADRADAAEWITHCREALRPHGSGRIYQGYPEPDLTEPGFLHFGHNVQRLHTVKAAWDPRGLFPAPLLRTPTPGNEAPAA